MNQTTTLIAASLIGLALAGPISAADRHTEVIAATCMSCHGPGGKSLGTIPSLVDLKQDDFVKRLQEFKFGKRLSSIMKRHAAGYTDAETEALAAYFASLQ
ncbi:c-type cytochrome [Thiobacillus sp.]|uniref:c-type cytochrome n=1 Tax=Thiobacillus sp. TaxID=924 RepID=UPI00286E101A|nr:c-type cytochrome [Thiobacillus sp.]